MLQTLLSPQACFRVLRDLDKDAGTNQTQQSKPKNTYVIFANKKVEYFAKK